MVGFKSILASVFATLLASLVFAEGLDNYPWVKELDRGTNVAIFQVKLQRERKPRDEWRDEKTVFFLRLQMLGIIPLNSGEFLGTTASGTIQIKVVDSYQFEHGILPYLEGKEKVKAQIVSEIEMHSEPWTTKLRQRYSMDTIERAKTGINFELLDIFEAFAQGKVSTLKIEIIFRSMDVKDLPERFKSSFEKRDNGGILTLKTAEDLRYVIDGVKRSWFAVFATGACGLPRVDP